jgi:NAD(P)-dependent dehydrogenase (short-subunit alcohol dehydrogenase family)
LAIEVRALGRGDSRKCHCVGMSAGSILVTGASSGIGEACALAFDRLGWEVFAGVRRDEDGKKLQAKSTTRLRPLFLDVCDLASIDAAVKDINARVGAAGLTAVINNAGIGLGGPVEYISIDEWRHQLDVNVIGQVAVTKAVLPLIRKAGSRGRIVFIGSVGGRVASPFIAPYAASKHAIEAIAESLRHELKDTGIRTIVIEPGAVRTPIWDKAESTADEIEASLPPEGLERYGSAIAGLRNMLQFQARTGIDPSVVAGVVEQAVMSTQPKARYLVGRDAKGMALIARVLPDRARDAVLGMGMKIISR